MRARIIALGRYGTEFRILEPFLADPSGPVYWIAFMGVPIAIVSWYLFLQGHGIASLAVALVAIALGAVNGLRKPIEQPEGVELDG